MATDPQVLAARAVEREIIAVEKQVTAALQAALKEIQSDMSALYNKFAVDGVLTRAQLTAANQLATAERQIIAELNKALAANAKTFASIHPEIYDTAFFRYAWSIDQTGGIRLQWGRLNLAAIRANLRSAEYTSALRRYGPKARAGLREALNRGLVRGLGFRDMMKEVSTAMGVTRGKGLEIARTEGMRAANAGTDATFEQAESEGVEGDHVWISTIDTRTRDVHVLSDGIIRGDDGLFTLADGERGPHPHSDQFSAGNVVNCRCTERFEITGYSPELRRTRDAGLIPQQTFAEWDPARARKASERIGRRVA